jgi:sulfate transport system ATP-binding protein
MSIEVQNITKTFNNFRALDNVSLHVKSGELLALLGPSGSGKTTLLRIIAGLEQADPGSGAIRFHDEDVADRHVRDRRVGFVFQHYALFRHMTVFKNVAFGLEVRPRKLRPSKSEIKDRVHALLKLVQLDGLAHRYPSQLSGGQRQRVALARALAVEPKVLLLDEPFGALDAKVRKELRDWIRKLHDEIHVTSVFVTHDQDEALEVADRVVVMNKGRIEQVGTPDEVFHQPKTEFVIDFLGQVNRFQGRIEQGKAVFGPLVVDGNGQALVDGKGARLFVRPHDLDVSPVATGKITLPAKIVRVQSAGAVVRVEVKTDDGQNLNVELSHDRFRELQLQRDQVVYLGVKESKLFVEDYVI